MGTSVQGRRDPVKAGFWGEHLSAWRGSGESIVGYCRRHGLLEQSFHYWKKTLSARDGAATGDGDSGADGVAEVPGKVALVARGRGRLALASGEPSFAEVRVVTESSASGVSVVLEGGREVRVGRGFDGETLQRVVAALESLSC